MGKLIDLRPRIAVKQATEGWSSEAIELARKMREDLAKLPPDHSVCKAAVKALRSAAEAGKIP